MAALIIANFMDLMDTTVVNVALPAIGSGLRASGGQLLWTVGAYSLGLAALLATGGRLGDVLGIRRAFLLGVAGFTGASLLAATAGTAALLVAARATQGAFAGVMVPQVLAGAQAMYPPGERVKVLGLIGLVTGSAGAAGPILSGWLITSGGFGLGWRSIFLINVPVGVAVAAVAARVVPDHRAPRPTVEPRPPVEPRAGLVGPRACRAGPRVRDLDLVGVALLTAATVCLTVPLVDGRQAGWPWWSWALLTLAPLLAAGFARWQRLSQRLGRTPLIPPRLGRAREFVTGAVVNLSFQAGLAGIVLIFSVYLQQCVGFTAMQTGLTWLGFSGGTLVAAVAAPALIGRVGPAVMPVGAGTTAGAVLAALGWCAAAAPAGPRWWQLSGVLAVAGIGMGLLVVPLYDLALAGIPAADAGAASGALGAVQQLGGALGVAVIGTVFYRAAGAPPAPAAMAIGLREAAPVAVVAFVLAGAVALRFRSGPRAERTRIDPAHPGGTAAGAAIGRSSRLRTGPEPPDGNGTAGRPRPAGRRECGPPGRPARAARPGGSKHQIRNEVAAWRSDSATTCATWPSWRTWTTARPPWWTRCCGSPGRSARMTTSPSGSWTRWIWSGRRASPSWPRTPRSITWRRPGNRSPSTSSTLPGTPISAARSSAGCRWSMACCCWWTPPRAHCRRPGSCCARRWPRSCRSSS